jgi:hypothetical protein
MCAPDPAHHVHVLEAEDTHKLAVVNYQSRLLRFGYHHTTAVFFKLDPGDTIVAGLPARRVRSVGDPLLPPSKVLTTV